MGSPPTVPPPVVTIIGQIGLVSGRQIRFSHVCLFEAQAVSYAQDVYRLAVSKLSDAGLLSGFGMLSPLNVRGIATLAAVSLGAGLVNHWDRKRKATEGEALLAEYHRASVMARNTGDFVPLQSIENIRLPDPATWNTPGRVLFGDSHIAFRTSDGKPEIIMWDKVETYFVPQTDRM